MKRIFLIVFYMMAVFCNSYAQHFKFMGIPIDGSIEAFDAKLKAKGFVKSKDFGCLDTKTSKYYDGKFAGYNVLLYVMATPKTNLVCDVNVRHFFKTKEDAEEIYRYFCSVIEDKYKIEQKKIQDTNSTRYKVGLGDIVVEYEVCDYGNFEYNLNVFYLDRKNATIFKQENKEDI